MVDFAEALRRAAEKKNVEPEKTVVPVRDNPLAAALAINTRKETTTAPKINALAEALSQKSTTQPQASTQAAQAVVEAIVDEAIDGIANIINGGIEDETPVPAISAEDFNHPEQGDTYSSDDVRAFHEGFEILRNNFEYPDMIGQSIAHCMQMLQEKPHLKEHLREADAKALIEGLRIGYGNAIQIKVAKSTKKSDKSKAASDFAKELDALGGIGNLGDYVP